jgi:hypothetical protein
MPPLFLQRRNRKQVTGRLSGIFLIIFKRRIGKKNQNNYQVKTRVGGKKYPTAQTTRRLNKFWTIITSQQPSVVENRVSSQLQEAHVLSLSIYLSITRVSISFCTPTIDNMATVKFSGDSPYKLEAPKHSESDHKLQKVRMHSQV